MSYKLFNKALKDLTRSQLEVVTTEVLEATKHKDRK